LFYFVAHPRNADDIRANGVRADDRGAIRVVTHRQFAAGLARDRVFCWPVFALFGIYTDGVTGAVGPDDVAEYLGASHRAIRQPHIGPGHLKYLGVVEADPRQPVEQDYLRDERMFGMTRKEVQQKHAIMVALGRKEADSGECHLLLTELLEGLRRRHVGTHPER
jgi:hypothetical protein